MSFIDNSIDWLGAEQYFHQDISGITRGVARVGQNMGNLRRPGADCKPLGALQMKIFSYIASRRIRGLQSLPLLKSKRRFRSKSNASTCSRRVTPRRESPHLIAWSRAPSRRRLSLLPSIPAILPRCRRHPSAPWIGSTRARCPRRLCWTLTGWIPALCQRHRWAQPSNRPQIRGRSRRHPSVRSTDATPDPCPRHQYLRLSLASPARSRLRPWPCQASTGSSRAPCPRRPWLRSIE